MNFEQNHSTFVAGRDINSHNVTNFIQNHLYPENPALLPAHPRCPLPSPRFTGRAVELRGLERFFFSDDPEDEKQIFMLIGMGGCGKSQIGYRFMHKYILVKDKFEPSMVFFIDATTITTLENSYIAIAQSKGIGETAKAALDWLANSDKPSFLLIDNADNPKINLREYLPRSMNSHVLITTRQHNAGRAYSSGADSFIDVEALPQDEAEVLFVRAAGVGYGQQEDVQDLLEELHCHALAVVQAAAGLRSLRISVKEYLDLFHKRRTALMNGRIDGVSSSDIDDYPWYILTTWRISYELLSEPERIFLDICAHLHHSGITEELFRRASSKVSHYQPDFPLSPGEETAFALLKQLVNSFISTNGSWDSLAFKRIVHKTLSVSLLRYDEATYYYIHPLIHDSLRQFAPNHLPTAFLLVLARKEAATDRVFLLSLVPHADRTFEACKSGETQLHPDIGLALGKICTNVEQGARAEALHRDAWRCCVEKLGEDHRYTLSALSALATTMYSRGRYEEAETMEIEVFEKLSRVLGPERSDALIREKRSQALGPDHPNTITSLANLVTTICNRGRYAEAEPLCREVLEKRCRILGADHPRTIFSLANLATIVYFRGRYDEAETIGTEVVEKRCRVLGDDHPDTIIALANLASIVQSRGRYDEAEWRKKDVLEKNTKVLGPDHPSTIRALANLASNVRHQGRYQEAEPMEREVLEKRVRLLRSDHPDTLFAMANLADTVRYLGRYEEAESMEREVLEKRERILGPDHPDTIRAISNLAVTVRSQSRYEEAEAMEKDVLQKRNRILGPDHPDSLRAEVSLSQTVHALDRCEEAEQTMSRVVQRMEEVLGADHPDTVSARRALSQWRGEYDVSKEESPVALHESTAGEAVPTIASSSLFASYKDLFHSRFRNEA